MDNSPAPERRWWRRPRVRLSVRGLMILVLIVGGGLGWVILRARVQREAVAAIRRVGGTVRYDWESRGGRPASAMGGGGILTSVKNADPPWPGWLVKHLGVDYFGSVTEVELWERGSDDAMVHVGRLGRLERLTLSLSDVTDAGLSHLRGMGRLRWLYLGGTRIGDAGLAHLEGLQLRGMGLDNTLVGDAGLAHLEGMTGLEQLDLSSTNVGDPGLVHLRRMAALEILSLDHTGVTDAGTSVLGGLGRLKFLQLEETRVSAAGLAHLKRLTDLAELRVSRAHVTEAALLDLRKERPGILISVGNRSRPGS